MAINKTKEEISLVEKEQSSYADVDDKIEEPVLFKDTKGIAKLRLLNYQGVEKIFEIGEVDTIAVINIEVITGDEHAVIIYKDYTIREFAADYATEDYHDYSYQLYRYDKDNNLIDDDSWKNRTGSYDIERTTWEES